jgi:hypothetical protein
MSEHTQRLSYSMTIVLDKYFKHKLFCDRYTRDAAWSTGVFEDEICDVRNVAFPQCASSYLKAAFPGRYHLLVPRGTKEKRSCFLM